MILPACTTSRTSRTSSGEGTELIQRAAQLARDPAAGKEPIQRAAQLARDPAARKELKSWAARWLAGRRLDRTEDESCVSREVLNTCVGTGTRSDGRPPHVCDGGLERYNRLWRLLLIQPTASREEVNRSSREEVNRSSREEVNRSSQEEVNRSSQEEVNRSRPVACTPPIHGHADPPGTADTLTYRPIAATDHRHHSSC